MIRIFTCRLYPPLTRLRGKIAWARPSQAAEPSGRRPPDTGPALGAVGGCVLQGGDARFLPVFSAPFGAISLQLSLACLDLLAEDTVSVGGLRGSALQPGGAVAWWPGQLSPERPFLEGTV